MFKLMVLSVLVAVAAAKPSGVIAPVSYAHGPIAYAHGPIAYAHAPVVQKTITYASEPVITGYSQSIIKPNLGHGLATSVETVQKQAVLAPARTVVDIQPEITVAHAPVAHAAVVHAPIAHAAIAHHEPVIAKVGEIVEKVPTAVSHQSSTVVHNSANVVTPIVAPVATKTVIAPAHLSYAAPLHTGAIIAAGPVAYSAPLHHTKTIAYSSPILTHGAPAVVQTW